MPLVKEINLTEARKKLSSLVREVANDDVEYNIKVHDRVVATLRQPQARLSSGEALLRSIKMMEKVWPGKPGDREEVTSENYKEYLYGEGGVIYPTKRR